MCTGAKQIFIKCNKESFGKKGEGAGAVEGAPNKENRSAVKQVLTRKRLLSRSRACRTAGRAPLVVFRRFLVDLEKGLVPGEVKQALKCTQSEAVHKLSKTLPPDVDISAPLKVT